MKPVRALLARGSVYTVATALQLSGALLILPVITRLLDPAEYGLVALGIIVTQLLSFIAGFGLAGVITRDYFRPERGPEVARGLVRLTILPALIIVVVADLTGPGWSAVFSDLDYDAALRIAVWSALPLALVISSQGLLRADDRAGAFVGVALVSSIVAQAAGVLAVVVLDGGPTEFMAGFGGSIAVAAILGLLLSRAIRAPVPSPQALREAAAIGVPTIPHSIAAYLLAFGNRIVIERVAGLDDVGRFQVAYGIGSAVIALLQAVNNAWAPLVFGAEEDRRWRTLADTAGALSVITALVVGALAMGAPLALLVAAPGDYDPSDLAPVTALIAFAALPYVLYLASVHIVFWRGRTGVLAWATPTSAVVNLGLVALLVPPLGLEGAGIATIAGYSVLALLVRLRSRGMAEVPWRTRRTILSAGAAGVMVGVSLLLPAEGSAWLVARGALVAAIATALVVVFHRLLAEEREVLEAGTEERPATAVAATEAQSVGPG